MDEHGVRSPLNGDDAGFPRRPIRRFLRSNERGFRGEVSSVEEGAKLFGLDSGRCDDDTKVWSSSLHFLEQTQKEVRRQRALVSLVHHHDRVACEQGIVHELAKEDAVGAELHAGDARGGDVLESHRVANLRAEHDAHLLGDARGDRLRGDPSRLSARNHAPAGAPARLRQVLRHLRRLAASRLPHQHCRRARLHEVQDGVAALEDGKTFPLCRKGEALIPVVHQQAPALTDAPAIHFRAQRQPCLRFLAPRLPERHDEIPRSDAGRQIRRPPNRNRRKRFGVSPKTRAGITARARLPSLYSRRRSSARFCVRREGSTREVEVWKTKKS